MNISSTGSTTANSSQIQSRITALQKIITQENTSADDAKTKATTVIQYQLQITEDELELQQLMQQAAQKSAPLAAASVGSRLDIRA